ncbi:MAG: hypothetical protein D6773_13320 [Alphaproteobacteria bacterium]|nr:MAG: hypothetical protein D6773_13320 [Alphaproteobacteria bacterium]
MARQAARRRPPGDAGTSFKDGNAADGRQSGNPEGAGAFFAMTTSGPLAVFPDTPCRPFLVMTKNASGRMVQYHHNML